MDVHQVEIRVSCIRANHFRLSAVNIVSGGSRGNEVRVRGCIMQEVWAVIYFRGQFLVPKGDGKERMELLGVEGVGGGCRL